MELIVDVTDLIIIIIETGRSRLHLLVASRSSPGKLNRGLSVVDTVEILKGRPLDETEYLHAALLGWCVELVREISIISNRMDNLD